MVAVLRAVELLVPAGEGVEPVAGVVVGADLDRDRRVWIEPRPHEVQELVDRADHAVAERIGEPEVAARRPEPLAGDAEHPAVVAERHRREVVVVEDLVAGPGADDLAEEGPDEGTDEGYA